MLSTGASSPFSAPALWLTGLERGLMLIGLAVALGGLAGRGLARQYLSRHPDVRPGALPEPWALRGSVLGLAAGAALLVTAVIGPGVAGRLAQPPVIGVRSSATGVIAAAELACFALAAILLRLRQPGWSMLPLSGVVVAEGIRSHPDGIIPVAGALLTYCHLLPALLWAGMLAYVVRAALAWRSEPAAVAGLVRLYGTAAAWLFSVVVVTGVVQALLLVPLGSLLTTAYGLFLVAKAAVVAVVAGLAIAGRVGLRHHPRPGAGPALATRLELAALALVLIITGILTVITPPAKPIFASAAPARQHTGPPAAGSRAAAGPAGKRAVDG